MKIFVTGGSGFIGGYLVPLLVNRGHEVLILERTNKSPLGVRTIHGDLYDPESYSAALDRFQPDFAIHLAWGGLPDYSFNNCRLNLLAGINLYELLARVGCNGVFVAGSCWEYGSLTGAVQEAQIGLRPTTFAAFKMALHTIGSTFCFSNDIRLIWGRPFFVYGPGQRLTSLIPTCYHRLRNGIVPEISNPAAINDFIHVADVADGIRALIECDEASGTYNIGTGKPTAVWQVVNSVALAMGMQPVYEDMPDCSKEGLWADTGKTKTLGWSPSIGLEDGISQTLMTWNSLNN